MDERQFNYLQEMDIPLWISRGADQIDEPHERQGGIPQQDAPVQPLAEVAPVEGQTMAPPLAEHSPLAEITVAESAAQSSATAESLDWDGLQRVVTQCERCPELVSQRHQTVFGSGDPQADWLFVGEAPGVEEDSQGVPFVGSAGQLLNAMLQALGLQRSQVYITNILKCHPADNRDPHAAEIDACGGYLRRQIELIQPRIIVAVGRVAAQSLLQSSETLGHLRGRLHHFEYGAGTVVPLVATYHPAYLLRKPQQKGKAWHDLKLALNSVGS